MKQDPNQEILAGAEEKFMTYVSEYGKSYGTKEEFQFRLAEFAKTLIAIEEHNKKEDETHKLGISFLSDWTAEERQRLLGYREPKGGKARKEVDLPEDANADSIDWRKEGAVTPIKNQGQCGSCWAFSTTGSMEGAHHKATGDLLSLSEQQFVDCDKLFNQGCNGGSMDLAFLYAQNDSVMTEADYPYVSGTTKKDGQCKYQKAEGKVLVSDYIDVKSNNPTQLKAALNKGPVSIAIEADKAVFQHYKGGIVSSASCGHKLDHGVLAVGYGSDSGQDYYIVKNSWGPQWGEDGYVRIAIESGVGICGIQSTPSYPITN